MTSQPSNPRDLRSSFAGFYSGKKIFITGHTGFKGSWLCLWLHTLGAQVTGYALDPPTDPSLFVLADVAKSLTSVRADVRDGASLEKAMASARPDIVIHMAAQPLVRDSYKFPVDTYAINVMGTVNLLEAVRKCPTVRAVINVTTDKCYENREWLWGYRENEPLGGYDPYSSSKACSEIVTAAYRRSFFNPREYHTHRVGLASARSGNVIGGGDWAGDRLLPDSVRALVKGDEIVIRNPHAIRPWQYVLEPLRGYLLLARQLFDEGHRYSEAWNFGPDDRDARPVEWVVKTMCEQWGGQAAYRVDPGQHPHEAGYLKLDCSKAKSALGWRPAWSLEKALGSIIQWTKAFKSGKNMREICLRQIGEYTDSLSREL